ncbi:hypothetical protein ZIOFF_063258 [Zingiber officinale]|uniref:HNH endonuclease domain-containing protein n=1 Tax=Zingiber officinale TaxID=94328 RepID=A0A8J5F612_ZINOF|nr:hypothetical protein ZIOFF_063258 [Zingiber officinale]
MDNPSSPRPRRKHEEGEESDRPRFFDAKAKAMCWNNADVVSGRHPDRWRKDSAGNVVCKRFCNCHGCLCYEFDHIIPFSKGGESTATNCQILQTRVNRMKSNKQWIDKAELEGFSCDIKFTGALGFLLCWAEVGCFNTLPSHKTIYKELDIIEMAVYGDVIRPGNQCRCRTVAEMMGIVKSKNPMAACELPYKQNQGPNDPA